MNRNDEISDSLTFEQFKSLAEREPTLEGVWIYRLTHYLMDKEDSYPSFAISKDEYFFNSYNAADCFLKERLIDAERLWAATYSFRIDQIPVGNVHQHTGAGWLYDGEGKLIDFTIATMTGDDAYQTSFFGRPDSRMRFKKGDIVEVNDDDAVKLAVVAADGPSIKWFWELYQRCSADGFGYHADASDDCYYLIDGPGFCYHSHINSLAMMKPRFHISDDIREYFDHCLVHAGDEDCRERYNVESIFPRNLATFGTTELRIVYDSYEKRHRLQVFMTHAHNERKSLVCPPTAGRYSSWLDEVQGGKARLWYIIRDWNENHRDEDNEPYLSPETPLSELL